MFNDATIGTTTKLTAAIRLVVRRMSAGLMVTSEPRVVGRCTLASFGTVVRLLGRAAYLTGILCLLITVPFVSRVRCMVGL